MLLVLPGLTIQLVAEQPQVQQAGQSWLGEWPGLADDDPAPRRPVEFHLRLVASLPPRPPTPPFFTTNSPAPLHVYTQTDGTLTLFFPEGGLVTIPPPSQADPTLTGWLTEKLLHSGRFEDLLWVSLAPVLRQAGLFMVHGFAAAAPDASQTILLVGRSGSGKTTTGLALLQAGYHYLGNDLVLLQQRGDGVMALPTPGQVINVRPKTFDLLPGLRPHRQQGTVQIQRWGGAGRVSHIYFPQVEAGTRSTLHPLTQAVGWARLMEESVDRWDTATLTPHLDLLHQLAGQARLFSLHLGTDVVQLPGLLTGNKTGRLAGLAD